VKIFKGTILKKNGEKTAVVAVTRVLVHPVYKKRVKRTRKYHVHDELGKSEPGQKVRFVASKPYSKTKKWKIYNSTAINGGNELNADMSSSFRRNAVLLKQGVGDKNR